jgi:glycosyltransferase involved in cell wall biosynthesis
MKIGFILLSNEQALQPSTRIAALNMFPHLRDAGWQPFIAWQPETACERPDLSHLDPDALADCDVVLFQKVHGPSVVALARALAQRGVRTVYSVCDLVQAEMAEACDLTLVISDYLKSLYPTALQPRLRVVHDGIENSALCKTDWGEHRGSCHRRLRAVLVTSAALYALPHIGNPPPWLQVDIVGRYVPEERPLARLAANFRLLRSRRSWRARWQTLRFLLNPRIRRIAWSPQRVEQALLEADIGILPIETTPAAGAGGMPPPWQVKSANRLTLLMSAGLPVASSLVPSYAELLVHGANGFLAHDDVSWRWALEQLRDPALRRRFGQRGREDALRSYSRQAQAASLLAALAELPRLPPVARGNSAALKAL